jgi:hypothetical protein
VDFNNLKVVSREERRKENFKVGKLLLVGFPCYVTCGSPSLPHFLCSKQKKPSKESPQTTERNEQGSRISRRRLKRF